ncbi:MAG TPA: rRNA maturation RNase YbeY [Candidatus Ornithomonoglobus merdipullorum]|uniref:Endoribonuclease YbeY n=1 Tax=Candidatus Ornithomonoglobus merdipullorum TaxID=2840895 RepID=A0A9D1SDQ1_9FIRM|nr:rRNA maturation RNase YbeY [Candidatus Ornithomonoglobus merdipullorum]
MVEFITEYDGAEELSEAQLDELRRVCEKVMENEDCDFDAEISLTFTDNEGIRAINAEYRGIDRATDVLSFPMLDFSDDEADAEFETDGEMVMLGDIVISAERAAEQAAELNHSLRRELAFLTAHSVLHLLGYDHVGNEEGEREMIEKQDRALGELGITRDIPEF